VHNLRKIGLDWWIIEILGLILVISGIGIILICNCPIFLNNTVSISQKISAGIGMLTICYVWGLAVGDLVKKVKRILRKRKNSRSIE
jgi:hypothetical protein